jgi:hypothetical protein
MAKRGGGADNATLGGGGMPWRGGEWGKNCEFAQLRQFLAASPTQNDNTVLVNWAEWHLGLSSSDLVRKKHCKPMAHGPDVH